MLGIICINFTPHFAVFPQSSNRGRYANVDVAARRITWGKLMNVGQSCISPDYVLCSQSIRDRLVEEMRKTIVEFYGSEVRLNSNARLVPRNGKKFIVMVSML